MPTEADTCRTDVVPRLQAAGWDNDPRSIAEQRTITDGRIVPIGKPPACSASRVQLPNADARYRVNGLAHSGKEVPMQKIVAALLISLLVSQAGVCAQDSITTGYENDNSASLSTPTAPTTIREAANRAATRLAATLASAQSQSQPQSWAGRHPVLLGTLIGVGTGVSLGATSCGCSKVRGGALVGAGAGAWGGLIASAIRTSHLRYERSSSQPDVAAVVRVVERLGVGERIVVTAVNSPETRGKIRAIGRDQFAVTPDGQTTSVEIAYADVEAVKGKVGAVTKAGIAGGATVLGIFLVALIGLIAAY